MSAFEELLAFQKQTSALGAVAMRLGWDQQTMMPSKASAMRGEEMAAMELVLHGRQTDPRIGEWIGAIRPAALEPQDKAALERIEWAYARAQKRPADLMVALARAEAKGFQIWSVAKGDENVADFLPILKELVQLRREEAAALSDGDPYDALLQDYERGMSAARLADMFDTLRPRLVELAGRIAQEPAPEEITGHFPKEMQLETARAVAAHFGYEFDRGRIDLALHPFCAGSYDDVRITTRVDEADPLNCLYSTVHEVGHATYEQQINPEFAFGPLAGGVSLGVHESQSRIYENQLGRSRGMTDWICDQIRAQMNGDAPDPERFYRAVNKVEKGFIRTESDEVHYNLHVALRFDLERALLSGDLQVDDLEAAWNDRMAKDFGLQVTAPSKGVLQDVHWSGGTFAYFPTYTLGNVYAGCLFAKMRQVIPDMEDQLAQGNPAPALAWLRRNIHVHGSRYGAQDLIEKAIEGPVSAEPLLQYLEEKYSAIYGL